MDEMVLTGQLRSLGPEHLHTLQTRSGLAADMRALGEYKDALELDLEPISPWSIGYGEEYRGTLSAAHNLALSYLLNGDFRRALSQDRLTLERRISVHGPAHPRTFNSGASVARDLLEAGRYAEAVSRIEAVWGQCRGTLGDFDRITLNARLLLGVALRCAGHADQADSYRRGQGGSDPRVRRGQQRCSGGPPEPGAELAAMGGSRRPGRPRRGPVRLREPARDGHPHSLICRLNIATAVP